MRSPGAPDRNQRSRQAKGQVGGVERLLASAVLPVSLVLGLAMNGCGGSALKLKQDRFDADRAMALVYRQVAVGQRPAGSPQLRHLATELRSKLPHGRFEPFATSGPQQGLRNIVGVLPGRPPAILIGAHYDTEWHPRGFVGANDSAAGTAAVIELARSLRSALPADHREIRFVLFDGEEDPPGCTDQDLQFCALRGSRAYAAAHHGEIGKMVLLDYIANQRARIPREGNSSPALWAKLRQAARQVGAEGIFPAGTQKSYVLDDHVPFLEQAVPSIDLIDFSFPFKDTVLDTPAYLDPAVLDAVGETVAQLVIDLSDQ